MSSIKIKCLAYLNLLGFDLTKFRNTIKGYSYYKKDYTTLKLQKKGDTQFSFGANKPIFDDHDSASGVMSGHYFHQDLYVAKKIFENKPQRHVDIGSRTDGFVSHLAVFREVEVFDIREQLSKVKNITFKVADLMQLPPDLIGYCDSLSALHSIEHFGLGRYGDPIDYNGHLKAVENIAKIVKPQGKFYFSVPIGPQRINFNAHRVFSVEYLLNILQKDFDLCSFAYVDDSGALNEKPPLTTNNMKNNFGCYYGCGIFELKKK